MNDVTKGHTVHRYDTELGNIRGMVMEMGELVLEQTRSAVRALTEGDISLARRVLDNEPKIDHLEVAVDEAIFSIIAKRQPAAADLRLVLALSRVASDLERAGDKAEQLAWCVIRVLEREGQPAARILHHLRRLDQMACCLLERSVDALVKVDVDLALDVFREEKDMDDEYDAAMRHLVTFVFEDTAVLGQMLDIGFALRALASVADHASSIAEQVIFVAKGRDVRYQNKEILIEALSRRT
jgi:phosphate transport system protein